MVAGEPKKFHNGPNPIAVRNGVQGFLSRSRSFAIHEGEGVRRWLGAHSRASRVGRTGRGAFSTLVFSLCADTGAATWREEEKGRGESKGTAEVGFSTGVGDGRRRQAELKKQEQIDGGAQGVRAPM